MDPTDRKSPPHNEDEQWVPVTGYEGLYLVSNLGRVRALPRISTRPHEPGLDARRRKPHNALQLKQRLLKGKYLRQGVHESDLRMVQLAVPESLNTGPVRYKVRFVHQLVAEHFIGPRPDGHVIQHRDGNKDNNRASNLNYVRRTARATSSGD